MKVEIKKLSLKRGDIVVVERSFNSNTLAEALQTAGRDAGIDFSVPIVFVDDIDSLKVIRFDGDKNG